MATSSVSLRDTYVSLVGGDTTDLISSSTQEDGFTKNISRYFARTLLKLRRLRAGYFTAGCRRAAGQASTWRAALPLIWWAGIAVAAGCQGAQSPNRR